MKLTAFSMSPRRACIRWHAAKDHRAGYEPPRSFINYGRSCRPAPGSHPCRRLQYKAKSLGWNSSYSYWTACLTLSIRIKKKASTQEYESRDQTVLNWKTGQSWKKLYRFRHLSSCFWDPRTSAILCKFCPTYDTQLMKSVNRPSGMIDYELYKNNK